MRCPECGAENPENSEFCGLCHLNFKEQPAGEETPGVESATPVDGPPIPLTPQEPIAPPPPQEPVAGKEPRPESEAAPAMKDSTQPGGPTGQLPPEAATAEYWEKTLETLKQQGKPKKSNTRKILLTAVVLFAILALLLLVGMLLLGNAKKKQNGEPETVPVTSTGMNSATGSSTPTGTVGGLSVTYVREIGGTYPQKHFQIAGTGFQADTKFALTGGGLTIPGTEVMLTGTTGAEVWFDLTSFASGSLALEVTNPDGSKVTLPNAVHVQP